MMIRQMLLTTCRYQRRVWALAWFALTLGGGTSVAAQGSLRGTPSRVQIEIPIGRSTRESWRWNVPSTPDGEAEYVWSARLDGDTTHTIGFMLFKFPSAAPREGSFAELLCAGPRESPCTCCHPIRRTPTEG